MWVRARALELLPRTSERPCLALLLFPSDLPSPAAEQNFLDTENLININEDTLVSNVKRTRVFVLLLTKPVLTRPWCLIEVYTALGCQIPIVPILLTGMADGDYRHSAAAKLINGLSTLLYDSEYMLKHWGIEGSAAWTRSKEDSLGRVKFASQEASHPCALLRSSCASMLMPVCL